MNTHASIVVVTTDAAPDPLLAAGCDRLRQLEQRWSRFLPDSEVSRLNRAAGTALRVSDDTILLVGAMADGWSATGGAFDPTLLGALVELGYAASRADTTLRTSLPAGASARGRPDSITVDRLRRMVTLPPGTAIDPGGIGKGLAADIVASELIATGALGALVVIGGDLRVAGVAPDTAGWVIGVDDATHRDDVTIALAEGGVATSTTRFRTWTADDVPRHHLIDPATLRPSANGTVSCTVVAGSAAWAEVFTKVAFAVDPDDAIAVFEAHSLAASLTTTVGAPRVTSAWSRFER